jgi:stage IV sporulation protein FB
MIEATPGFWLLLAALYGLGGGKLWAAFVLSVGLHEAGHMAALAVLDCPIRRLRLTAVGAELDTAPLSYRQEALCALAGPLVNLGLFVLLRRPWPMAAALSLGLAVFNLLPVWPLDGGRALASLAVWFMTPEEGRVVTQLAAGASLCFVCAAAVVTSWHFRLGIWPLLAAAWMLFRALSTGREDRKPLQFQGNRHTGKSFFRKIEKND